MAVGDGAALIVAWCWSEIESAAVTLSVRDVHKRKIMESMGTDERKN